MSIPSSRPASISFSIRKRARSVLSRDDYAFEGVQPFFGFLGVDVSPDLCVFAAMVLSPHDLRVAGCCRVNGNVLSLQTEQGSDHDPNFS